jgi:uncharacterized membrane protein
MTDIIKRMCAMKYVWIALKVIGYSVLAILLLFQIIGLLASSSIMEFIGRGSILLVVGLFFAIKWQRRNKPKDTATQDKPDNG